MILRINSSIKINNDMLSKFGKTQRRKGLSKYKSLMRIVKNNNMLKEDYNLKKIFFILSLSEQKNYGAQSKHNYETYYVSKFFFSRTKRVIINQNFFQFVVS